MKKNRIKRIAAGFALAILLLAVLFVLIFTILTRKTNFRRDDEVEVKMEAVETETELVLHAEDIYDLSEVVPVEENRTKGTYTLLVIGGETMEEQEERSDAEAIILMTINHNAKTVFFETLHTGMYAQIPGVGGYRLGNAYAVGGGPLLSRTIEENYGIRIDNYAAISLKEVARIIEMPEFEQLDISRDGLEVVEELLYGLGARSPSQIMGYISTVLPYVTHNIENDQMVRIVMTVPAVIGYYSEKAILPYEGLYTRLDGYLVPDIGETARRLQDTMYGPVPAQEETETEMPAR